MNRSFSKEQTIFVYQKNHPNIVLLKLDAKAKPLATLNRQLVQVFVIIMYVLTMFDLL